MLPTTPNNLETPFLIRVEHLDKTSGGYFRPSAFVAFSSLLRTSGMLNAIAPEGLKDLLLMLTFATPNGHCAPSVSQLAESMRVSPGKARGRMERLMAFRWQGEPLLIHSQLESGLEVFAPCPWLARVSEDSGREPHVTPEPPIMAAPREAVIAHTRATYARPRAEVEREIEEMMGYSRDQHGRPFRTPPGTPPASASKPEAAVTKEQAEAMREQHQVREMLLQAGLQVEQAEALLAGYDTVRIRRQLMWLPHRRAKNPAGMLLAAVKDDYEAPPALWRSTSADLISNPSPATQSASSEPSTTKYDSCEPTIDLKIP